MIPMLFFAAILFLIAVVSIRWQLGNLRRLRAQTHVPSDDRSYLRKQANRRIVMGALMLALAGTLAGGYFSGIETRADQIGQKRADPIDGKPCATPEAENFLRLYAVYWCSVLALLFLVLGLAIIDLWATRRYAWDQMRRIQSENRAMLERDLAVYRQQKINDRMRKVE
jgi:hypothetical protein